MRACKWAISLRLTAVVSRSLDMTLIGFLAFMSRWKVGENFHDDFRKCSCAWRFPAAGFAILNLTSRLVIQRLIDLPFYWRLIDIFARLCARLMLHDFLSNCSAREKSHAIGLEVKLSIFLSLMRLLLSPIAQRDSECEIMQPDADSLNPNAFSGAMPSKCCQRNC